VTIRILAIAGMRARMVAYPATRSTWCSESRRLEPARRALAGRGNLLAQHLTVMVARRIEARWVHPRR